MLHVLWKITGVLPAPTPIAGVPEEYAALTIPGPPVAKIKSTSRITVFVNSILGASIHAINPFGAPAASIVSRITWAV